MKRLLCLILFLIPLVVLTSCSASELTQPKVIINSPVSGSQYRCVESVTIANGTMTVVYY